MYLSHKYSKRTMVFDMALVGIFGTLLHFSFVLFFGLSLTDTKKNKAATR